MKRAVPIAGALAALAIVVRWAASPLPPAGISGTAAPEVRPDVGRNLSRLKSLAKLKTLEEIMRSRNDNDPRLDRDFNALSPEAKRLFRKKYREIPAERRNERGTIVYLLGGGNLRAAEDWAFLREVAAEPPCLSLSDCSRKPKPGGGEEAAGDEVTLAYPSLVALKQAERALEAAAEAPGPAEKEAMSVIEAGKNSRTRAVARLAERIGKRFSRS